MPLVQDRSSTELVGVGLVLPGNPVRLIVRAGAAAERNRRNTIEFVRAGEYAVEREAGWRRIDADRGNVDAVAVVVERDFVQQAWVDDRACSAPRALYEGLPKRVADRGNVVTAPHRGAESLRNLFRDPVSEDGVLAVEFVIDAHDLFTNIGRRAAGYPGTCVPLVGAGKIPAAKSISCAFGSNMQEGMVLFGECRAL